ncbi:DUF7342 family protein [Halorubrum ezzemoulense]|uniref:Sugar-specific transcriptional regulator TrmB n=1 Tax=Halorubrum ezzemoulense TaxID=337243 RepID=A0A481RCI0_HALEZ|nr:hypothetical protein [Halorubrum ezzemoulense]QAY18906.1 hypothetical protein EO776_02195 [Halorubrum ezzemoulense]
MEDPGSDIQADTDERVPNFDALTPPEEVVRGDRTRDDFFDAVLGLNDPATAGEVAERAGHGVDAAREYLDWFERMGIVTKVTDSPATYERNQEYLNWRRVQTLRREYATEELLDLLQSESERADALAAEFDAESPTGISITQYAAASDQSIEDVWEQLSSWETARRRVFLLERALTPASGEAIDRESAA